MQKEELLQSLKQQLESTNIIKQANDKEIKRCRTRIQELELANKPLQQQSDRIYKQIQTIESPSGNITLNSAFMNSIAEINPEITVSQLSANINNAVCNYYSNGDNEFDIGNKHYRIDNNEASKTLQFCVNSDKQ